MTRMKTDHFETRFPLENPGLRVKIRDQFVSSTTAQPALITDRDWFVKIDTGYVSHPREQVILNERADLNGLRMNVVLMA